MLPTLDLHRVAYSKMAAEACAPDINLHRLIAHANLLEAIEKTMEQFQLDAILKARHETTLRAKLEVLTAAQQCPSSQLERTDQARDHTYPLDMLPVPEKFSITSQQDHYLAPTQEENFTDVSLSDKNSAGSLIIITTREIKSEV